MLSPESESLGDIPSVKEFLEDSDDSSKFPYDSVSETDEQE